MAKIFVVDDEVIITKIIEGLVKDEGHQIASVNNSWTAIEKIKEEAPNVILLDVMMPKINGIELCRMIKANSDIKHIPVVMISVLSDKGTKNDSFNAGAEDFLVKPLQKRKLLKTLDSIIKSQ